MTRPLSDVAFEFSGYEIQVYDSPVLKMLARRGVVDWTTLTSHTCVSIRQLRGLGPRRLLWVSEFLRNHRRTLNCGCPGRCTIPTHTKYQGLPK